MKWGNHGAKRAKTRVICTIGPACRSPKKIEALIAAGMNVARLHFSYSGQKEHAKNIRRIRHAARKLGREIKILADLSGTKIRLGEFKRKSVNLKVGNRFLLTSRPVKGDATVASVNFPEMIPCVRPGDTILLADGALKLRAVSLTVTDVRCEVVVGGNLKAKQAVHVLNRSLPMLAPTPKDLDDARFSIQHRVDWMAQSYATTAAEINELRRFIKRSGARMPIVAKIERRDALKNLKQIVGAADLVMVARGDLGLEIGVENIGLAQKEIVECAKRAGKPVIIATEMLFSMMENTRPTRAEVTDITNAVLDGAAGVMLSGESAIGRFPIQATRTMAEIVEIVGTQRR